MFVDSLIINPGNDGYSFPKERPSSSGGIGGSIGPTQPDYRLKYDGKWKIRMGRRKCINRGGG